jgi:hypothetical protein
MPAPLAKSGTVVGVARLQHGKHLLPVILLLGAVEGGEDKHEHLGAHAYGEQLVAALQVQDFEQGAPYHHGGAYTVSKVEEALARVAREEALDNVFVFFDFTHFLYR